jgi:phospholipid/cholesterol/gamma-HCH transport system substrate-binding protein
MRKISYFKLGLFLVLCALVGAVALIWIGATRVFESSTTYAAFFSDAVTGLQSGAPVRHLGIRIGNVDAVDLTAGDRLVRVLVKIRSGFRLDPSMALSLTQAGLTGSPFLALEEAPAAERKEAPHPPTEYRVLPTRSGGGGIGGAVQGIEKKISSLDIQGLIDRWEGVAARIEASLSDGKLTQVIEDAREASLGVRRVAGPGPEGGPSQLESIVRDLRATAASLKAASTAISRQVQAVRPGTAAAIATRIERTTDLGEDTVRNIDENLAGSVALLRQDLAQLKQAVVETQALARSLRNEPGRLIERGGGTDPFRR